MLNIELADTPSKRERGLMGVKDLPYDNGMLFIFPHKQKQSFWMYNTYIPLDIAFIDDQGYISQIENMCPLSTRMTTSKEPCSYALEVNEGWFKENGIDVGRQIFPEKDWVINLKREAVYKNNNTRYAQVNIGDEIEFEQNQLEGELPEDFQDDLLQEPNQQQDINQQQNQQQDINRIVEINMNQDQKINYANQNKIPMEIIYWTLSGKVLPPRKLLPLDIEGYPIKNGPNGSYLVAYDNSPSIYGNGWEIAGGTPKNFLIDNIIKLDLIQDNYQEEGNNLNNLETNNRGNFWDRLKGYFEN